MTLLYITARLLRIALLRITGRLLRITLLRIASRLLRIGRGCLGSTDRRGVPCGRLPVSLRRCLVALGHRGGNAVHRARIALRLSRLTGVGIRHHLLHRVNCARDRFGRQRNDCPRRQGRRTATLTGHPGKRISPGI
ncbi:hypothetical protein D3C87_1530560 [compost metagenome]